MPAPESPSPRGLGPLLAAEASSLLRDASASSWLLFKAMIPAVIVVKVLQELDLIVLLARPLEPLMALVGLPASMGLVWATAMLNNIYAAMVVFVSLASDPSLGAGLSQAQATVLCVMMLIAHSLPVELKVARQCGPTMLSQGVIRVGAAMLCGMAMHWCYAASGWLSQPNAILFTPGRRPDGWGQWAWDQTLNLLAIFAVIVALMALMRLLKVLRVTDLLVRLLAPLLRLVGVGRDAAAITVVGLALGLTYGGGLIINESRSGRIGMRDVFNSVTFMGLTHALIEDTLLMVMLGADFQGVFWGRLLFSLALLAVLARMLARMPDHVFARRLMRPA